MTIPERPTHILAVDDDAQVRRALSSILSPRGYRVALASTADEAISDAIENTPDLIVLDLALPDRSGLEVCRELRSWTRVPILVLSVRSSAAEKIEALYEGADDYLTKPFSAGELLARVRALLRRAAERTTQPACVVAGELAIDIARRRVSLGGEEIDLTPTEFDLLAYLARNADLVVTNQQILEHVWGSQCSKDPQLLRVHISNLRKKIQPTLQSWHFIMTEPRVGFRFCLPPDGEDAKVGGQ
jgi:two-component system KDP operon response regulator KdpE